MKTKHIGITILIFVGWVAGVILIIINNKAVYSQSESKCVGIESIVNAPEIEPVYRFRLDGKSYLLTDGFILEVK